MKENSPFSDPQLLLQLADAHPQWYAHALVIEQGKHQR
jgi:hypothetical protein